MCEKTDGELSAGRIKLSAVVPGRGRGVRQRREGAQHRGGRQLRRAGPHLRHPPRRHRQGRLRRQALGHRQGLVQEDPDGLHHQEEEDVRGVSLQGLHPG